MEPGEGQQPAAAEPVPVDAPLAPAPTAPVTPRTAFTPPALEAPPQDAAAQRSTRDGAVDEPHASARPGVGLIAAAGLHTGLALGLRVGAGDVGVELAGGYQLLLAISRDEDLGSDIDAGSSAQGGAELYVTPWHPNPSAAIGLKTGYRYNSVLHHGFSVAITFLVDLTDRLALEGLAGASFFPGSEERLREELGLASSTDIMYASSAQFFEYGFELIWYPF